MIETSFEFFSFFLNLRTKKSSSSSSGLLWRADLDERYCQVGSLARAKDIVKCPKMSSTRTEISCRTKGCQKRYHRDNWLVAAKFIAMLLFYPSMSTLPIIVKQNSPSVGLFSPKRECELGLDHHETGVGLGPENKLKLSSIAQVHDRVLMCKSRPMVEACTRTPMVHGKNTLEHGLRACAMRLRACVGHAPHAYASMWGAHVECCTPHESAGVCGARATCPCVYVGHMLRVPRAPCLCKSIM
ncbi:hypothetical protein E5676_scaffold1704G00240 [Cucumis melo var. makuwa]|uniref:Uncharacterized protein n=1 Tax=Cucumis melo var. makuwa TaxID=1194695 RepID=A0A5D3E515_CUCMM|nr:hypothetical protein E5676_scaffold1704G00240 [Cucumis melo var. makuwa]